MLNLKVSDMQMKIAMPKEEEKKKAVKSMLSNIGGFSGINYIESQDQSTYIKVDQLLSKPTAWFASGIKAV